MLACERANKRTIRRATRRLSDGRTAKFLPGCPAIRVRIRTGREGEEEASIWRHSAQANKQSFHLGSSSLVRSALSPAEARAFVSCVTATFLENRFHFSASSDRKVRSDDEESTALSGQRRQTAKNGSPYECDCAPAADDGRLRSANLPSIAGERAAGCEPNRRAANDNQQ